MQSYVLNQVNEPDRVHKLLAQSQHTGKHIIDNLLIEVVASVEEDFNHDFYNRRLNEQVPQVQI